VDGGRVGKGGQTSRWSELVETPGFVDGAPFARRIRSGALTDPTLRGISNPREHGKVTTGGESSRRGVMLQKEQIFLDSVAARPEQVLRGLHRLTLRGVRGWISRLCPRVVDMLQKPPGSAWPDEAIWIIGPFRGGGSSRRDPRGPEAKSAVGWPPKRFEIRRTSRRRISPGP
jgi:hypothetical protein